MKTVLKIEEGMNRQEIACTTYQMRNPFRQFYDGVASELDVHCYMQHAMAADLCPKGGKVLDICCGRGLLIPFLRYRAKPSVYVGVDVAPSNARWKDGADPRRESESKKDWGFETVFVESNVAEMDAPLKGRQFNLLVYTSAIEHMHPTAQQASLKAARKLAAPGATLFLTCPVTEEGANGYEAQYAAHVYEPKESELLAWLKEAGWIMQQRAGLCTKASTFKERLAEHALAQATRLYDSVPRELSLPAIAALFPESATEVAYTCTADEAEFKLGE